MKEEVRTQSRRWLVRFAVIAALVCALAAVAAIVGNAASDAGLQLPGVETAFAAEGDATEANATHGEAAQEVSGISAILPDWLEFVPMLIAFIILWIILAKFGWPMFNAMLDKRETTIREALKKSEEAQIESERTLQEYQRQLADAKAQASQIIADARAAGDTVKADITSKAQAEAADIIAKAKEAIEAEKKQAIIELQNSMADNAVNLATRLVGEGLNETEQRKIIERYVNEAGGFNGN